MRHDILNPLKILGEVMTRLIHEYLTISALKYPQDIAVSFNNQNLTYQELDQLSNQLSHQLVQKGVKPGDIVGLCFNRSLDLIVSLFGILKAGAAYLPLDSEYPKERLDYMINHAQIKHLLINHSLSEKYNSPSFEKIIYENIDFNKLPNSNLGIQIERQNLCYVIYTSGSTGNPKGVSLSHGALVNLIEWQNRHSIVERNAITLQFTPISFDVHFQEIVSTIAMGGHLAMISEDLRLNSVELIKFIDNKKVARIFLPFVALNHLSEVAVDYGIYPKNLIEVTTAGEQLKITPKLREFFKNLDDRAILNNHYGPSETHVVTSYTLKKPASDWMNLPPIGRVIDNTRIHILDENFNEVINGTEGELYFSGLCLANGYLYNLELTNERFINHPKFGRLYKTGDIGFIGEDGNIIFLGRKDGQVKIRGYRIEVGEIEVAIQNINDIGKVAVKVIETEDEKYLVGYYTGKLNSHEIRDYLRAKLPEYMIPKFLIQINEMPMTPSGKIDRKLLPLPTLERPNLATEYIAPQSQNEKLIYTIWEKYLKISGIGIKDNFFDLGGNSLLALKIVVELNEKYQKDINIVQFFQSPNIYTLSKALDKNDDPILYRLNKIKKLKKENNNDIAIIAMNGRFPGANSIDEFWKNLLSKENVLTKFNDKELDHSISEDLKKNPNYVKVKGMMPDYDKFDARFFGITPREAEIMDPQQRKFLELSYEALELAGYAPNKYQGSIGVFAGMANNSYKNVVEQYPEKIEQFGEFNVMLANEKDYIATRVSHKLNLKGPSLSIHTGCSTSLVAIIQAVKALRSGDCDISLAGGIAISGIPHSGYLYQEGGMLSKDGICRPFDKNSSGTLFNDGAGVLVLKRLVDAEEDGDYIHAVIKGVALNNDGSDKMSFTAPSMDGQAEVIVKAQIDGDIDADSIGYVEAHGTATPVGDPIEVEGLKKAFAFSTQKNNFCYLGSVKSNIGHLTSAAGVAGVIKSVLCLDKKIIPGTANFSELNPNLRIEKSPFIITNENVEFPKYVDKRRAAVSSFGVGGTNAHLILEEYTHNKDKLDIEDNLNLLKISAKTEEDLINLEKNLTQLINVTNLNLGQIAYTLDVGREDYSFKKFLLVNNLKEIIKTSRVTKSSAQKEIVFMFPGQGSQYLGMGEDLCKMDAIFNDYFQEGIRIYNELTGKNLKDIIFSQDEKNLQNTYYTQPALFIFEYSLAMMFINWGIEPKLLLGHSVGEFVAASLAGVFTFEDGIKLISKRAELMTKCQPGSMLSVNLSKNEIQTYIDDKVQIAAVNAHNMLVVSGPNEAIELLETKLNSQNILNKRLHTSHAFHSEMMSPVVEEFKKYIEKIILNKPVKRLISTVSCTEKVDQFCDPHYWADHLRKTVDFEGAIKELIKNPNLVLIEVGPRQTLTALSKKISTHAGMKDYVSLNSTSDNSKTEREMVLKLVGELWTLGHNINIETFYPEKKRKRVPVTTYPFKKQIYWLKTKNKTTKVNKMTNSNLIEKLNGIFEEASGINVSEFDNETTFLEMGMDSLFLTQVALNIKKEFKKDISFRQLMENYTTINSLAKFIDPSGELVSSKKVIEVQSQAQPKLEVKMNKEEVTHEVQKVYAPQNLNQLSSSVLNGGIQDLISKQLEIMNNQLMILSGSSAIVNLKPDAAPTNVLRPKTEDIQQAKKEEVSPKEEVVKVEKKKVEVDNADRAFGASPRITTKKKLAMTNETKDFLSKFFKDYSEKTKGSKKFTQDNRKNHADPRVVSGFKPESKEIVYPIVVKKSQAQYLYDLDDNKYIDMTCGFGSNFFGNGNDHIKKLMQKQIEEGIEVGPQHPLTAEVSKLICELTGNDRAAFCNTGSEAVLGAMRVARTVTGREKIVVFTGSYHGINDEVIIRANKTGKSYPASPGINSNSVSNMIVLDYGTEESLQKIKEICHEVAAVLVEPVQSRRADFHPKEFLKEVRKITQDNQTCLIFDEVITGFRIHKGGAQAYFDIRADLCCYGKIVGGGMPIGVLSGKSEFMDALDGGFWQYGDESTPTVGVTYFAGTFVRHPLALAAAKGALEILKNGGDELFNNLNNRAQKFVDEINLFCQQLEVPFEMVNFGSLMKPKWKKDIDHSDILFALFRFNGVHVYDGFPWFVNLAHTDEDLKFVISAIKKSIATLVLNGVLMSGDKVIYKDSPVAGAKLGKDENGAPAWFMEDPQNPGEFLQIQA
jgi:amino acid adenylation domain-containing protein